MGIIKVVLNIVWTTNGITSVFGFFLTHLPNYVKSIDGDVNTHHAIEDFFVIMSLLSYIAVFPTYTFS